jgi:hypothetical protein
MTGMLGGKHPIGLGGASDLLDHRIVQAFFSFGRNPGNELKRTDHLPFPDHRTRSDN